jgi:hypothetical protein
MIIPCHISDVFEFFGNAANLENITPPELHFQILTPEPIAMGQGTLIDLLFTQMRPSLIR